METQILLSGGLNYIETNKDITSTLSSFSDIVFRD